MSEAIRVLWKYCGHKGPLLPIGFEKGQARLAGKQA